MLKILDDYIQSGIWFETKVSSNEFYGKKQNIESFILIYVDCGSLTIDFFEDSNQMKESIHVKSGDIVFINSGVCYEVNNKNCASLNAVSVEFVVSKRTSNYYLNIKKLSISSLNFELFSKIKKPYILIDGQNEIKSTLILIQNEYNSNETNESLLIMNSLISILFIKISNSIKHESFYSNLNYVEKAIEYINIHYNEEIYLKDIASYVNVNASYLEKLIKKNLYMTFTEYVNKVRIMHSRKWLEDKELQTIDVAMRVGFNSRQHFFRTFKKIVGKTPYEYRKSVEMIRLKQYINPKN